MADMYHHPELLINTPVISLTARKVCFFAAILIPVLLASCGTAADYEYESEVIVTDRSAVYREQTHRKGEEIQNPEAKFIQFLEMAEQVGAMDTETLKNLTDEQVDSLGRPVYELVYDTELLSRQALNRIRNPLQELEEKDHMMTRSDHQKLSEEVMAAITPMAGFNSGRRILQTADLRELLMEINVAGTGTSAVCRLLFNEAKNAVLLFERDNFAAAAEVCPENTRFLIMPGIHKEQTVRNTRPGSSWIGLRGAVMDGMNRTDAAFDGSFVNHLFSFFEIRNYTEFGIVDKTGESMHTAIRKMTFRNIGRDVDGQTYGAVKFLRSQHIYITKSYFENVTTSIHMATSRGPLKVLDNDALNPGRNFFQCDKCTGPGIHIMKNTMENTTGFGLTRLEDFINIFASEGEKESPIRVNYNRARTNGRNLSASGSFIILGDFGGKHQEAIGNVGVNPGQVGIGAASGDHILVKDNRMYSTMIHGISNVAYYSWRTPSHAPACSDHHFKNNTANWICGRSGICRFGEPNRAWSAGNCGLSNEDLLLNTVHDPSISEAIWYQALSRTSKGLSGELSH